MIDAMPTPVPPLLRRAIIEAMGGWGPFTVREIESLFEDHEFFETDPTVTDQGVRRTSAAQYLSPIDWERPEQRTRVIAIAEAVLDHYPAEPDEPAGGPGRRLRRILQTNAR